VRRDRAVAASVATLAATLALPDVRINLSPSIPLGLYALERVGDRGMRRESILLVCLPRATGMVGRERGYLLRGSCPGEAAPVGKPVFAIAGDTVTVRDGIERCRGVIVHAPPLDRDAASRPLTRMTDGTYVVAPGTIWLLSESPRSWDSRYYGPVPVGGVRGVLRRVGAH
jgi:conjugative transfer signal peptidase TraF